MLNHMEMKSRPRASDFQINNVRQWLDNANDPIAEEEVTFVRKADQEDDLIPVVSKPKTPLRRFIDRSTLLRLPTCFRERKVSEETSQWVTINKLTCPCPREIDACSARRISRCRQLYTTERLSWIRLSLV